MRAAIATLVDDANFGNRLQNYALQEVLKQLGFCTVETLPSAIGTHHGYGPVAREVHLVLGQPRQVARAVRTRLAAGDTRQAPSKRSPLAEFSAEAVSMAALGFGGHGGSEVDADAYDYFVVGSDQVWNPVFGLPKGLDFLQFAQPEQRVSYAASFGVDSVPLRLRPRYKRGILGLASLSVREQQGAHLCQELAGRKAQVVLDPTMLHSSEFWVGFAGGQSAATPVGDYVAVAFLGQPLGGAASTAVDAARGAGLGCVDLLARDPATGTPSRNPREMVGLIRSASRVVTDSFHVAAFATTLGRDLQVLGRGRMNSRIESLLFVSGRDPIQFRSSGDSGILTHHEGIDECLMCARQGSWRFLEGAFG